MKKLIISSFVFISIISFSFGQDVIVRSAFDSTQIYIGDQIKFTITVDKPSSLKLTLPVLKDTLAKNIEIVSGPTTDSTLTRDGRTKIIQKYLVTSFDSGRYQVKPVFAETKNAGGLKRFYSDYSLLEVMRVKITPPDTTAKIFDIIPPYKAPVTIGEVLPWALLVVFAGVIVWAVIKYLPRLKKAETGIEAYIPKDPAHVIAFRELERLKSEKLWQIGEIKKYYTRLTEILRQYLEDRYSVYSLELTTAETLDALVKTGFKKDSSYNDLKTVLNGADLVKFAKYNPLPSENEIHFQNAWNFVLATKENIVVSDSIEEKITEQEAIL
jgi:uncharacterized repeat protein (TIGR01451 family)